MHQQDEHNWTTGDCRQRVWTDRHAHNKRSRHMPPGPLPGCSCRAASWSHGWAHMWGVIAPKLSSFPQSSQQECDCTCVLLCCRIQVEFWWFLLVSTKTWNKWHVQYSLKTTNSYVCGKEKKSNEAMLISIFENSLFCFSSEFKIFFFF